MHNEQVTSNFLGQMKERETAKNLKFTLPGCEVTEMTYHPKLSLSKRLNSKETSYVKPKESRTVVKSLSITII